MKRIWCEWDIWQEDLIFRDEAAAMRWMHLNPILLKMAEEEGLDFEAYLHGLMDNGLIGLDDVHVIE